MADTFGVCRYFGYNDLETVVYDNQHGTAQGLNTVFQKEMKKVFPPGYVSIIT